MNNVAAQFLRMSAVSADFLKNYVNYDNFCSCYFCEKYVDYDNFCSG
jgi:hypothetical protein